MEPRENFMPADDPIAATESAMDAMIDAVSLLFAFSGDAAARETFIALLRDFEQVKSYDGCGATYLSTLVQIRKKVEILHRHNT
jgi:hypothetical protein